MAELAEIGRAVAVEREKRRLELRALAGQAAVPADTLAALERGHPGITTTELARVAAQLELDAAALLQGRAEPRPKSSIFLRHSGAQDFSFEIQPVLDAALEAGRALRFLNRTLGCAPDPSYWHSWSPSKPTQQAAREGYRLANSIRQFLGISHEPLPDVATLLEERFEVPVLVEVLPSEKMTAVSVRDDSGAGAVVLNAADPQRAANRHLDRVYLAHELCHLIGDPSEGGLHIVIDRASDESSKGRKVERAEQRARGFAAELLMPRSALLDLLGPPAEVASPGPARKLAARARRHFSTPWEIALNHLNHHGFVSDDARTELLEEGPRSASAGPATTRLPAPGAASLTLADRVRRASEEGILTDGQARAALRLTPEQALPWL